MDRRECEERARRDGFVSCHILAAEVDTRRGLHHAGRTAIILEETRTGLRGLGNCSTVTYYWYRFADHPTMWKADFSGAERETMQTRVEKLHRTWTKEREYLPPPMVGALVELDPAEIVAPPKGLEARLSAHRLAAAPD